MQHQNTHINLLHINTQTRPRPYFSNQYAIKFIEKINFNNFSKVLFLNRFECVKEAERVQLSH